MSNLFLDNKYTNWYTQIISKAKTRENPIGYTEKHHIIPKALHGDDSKENLAILTFKEHFICHRLLVKMVKGKAKIKMAFSFRSFCRKENGGNQTLTSGQYSIARKILVDTLKKLQTGKTFDERFGIKRSTEIKEAKRKSMKARREFERQNNIGNPNAKIWLLTDPNGIEYIVTTGLNQWCQNNGVHYQAIRRLYYVGVSTIEVIGWSIIQI